MSKNWCLYPAQCGIGMDCSPCLENRITELEGELKKYTEASSNKSDWCPCCKQGWNCAEDEVKQRKQNHIMREALEYFAHKIPESYPVSAIISTSKQALEKVK